MTLANTHTKLAAGGDFTIVYMGGSITQAGTMPRNQHMEPWGYRDHITDWLRRRYPDAQIRDVHAAVAGTGSEFGVLRMEKDVHPYRPDLVFVEYAVNDGGGDRLHLKQTMEGIVRQIWSRNPMADIVFVYTLGRGMFYDYAKEKLPGSIAAHTQVARYYGIPEVTMGWEFWLRELRGEMDWDAYFNDDVHPNAEGHAFYGQVVARELTPLLTGEAAAHTLPPAMTPHPWTDTHMTYAKDIPHPGWTEENHVYWNYDLTWVCSDQPGQTLQYDFEGNLIGVYWHLAMDTGDVEISIDGEPWRRSPTWDGWVLQAPERINYKIWADDLPDGPHQLRLRIADGSQWAKCQGNHIQLIAFMTAKF